jgi:hypothetical protein
MSGTGLHLARACHHPHCSQRKKAAKLCIVAVKTTCRAIANAVVLDCKSFTRCSHAHLDKTPPMGSL